jgi:hypothetical protein
MSLDEMKQCNAILYKYDTSFEANEQRMNFSSKSEQKMYQISTTCIVILIAYGQYSSAGVIVPQSDVAEPPSAIEQQHLTMQFEGRQIENFMKQPI